MLRPGDVAPEIDLPATDGTQFRLADRRGKYVVVYFFPRAFTPNCKKEAERFRDNRPELEALGADVVGISMDAHATQCDFANSTRVTFPMVADEDGRVSRNYGVLWPLLGIPRRATFVVGPTQRIEAVFWHEIQVSRHLDQVVQFLRTRTSHARREAPRP